MRDEDKTKEQLISELNQLRRQVKELNIREKLRQKAHNSVQETNRQKKVTATATE